MKKSTIAIVTVAVVAAVAAACVGTAPPPRAAGDMSRLTVPGALPASAGWGTHVIALERGPDAATWVGTYGDGMYVWGPDAEAWHHFAPGRSGSADSITGGFVNSIAFQSRDVIWYGTIGNGFGRSTDGGKTWRKWTSSEPGARWQYVVPQGIVVRNDSVYIATSDGLRISGDKGDTWRCIEAAQVAGAGNGMRDDGCTSRTASLPSQYLLSLDVARGGAIWAGHLGGLSVSRDGGRTWTSVDSDGIAGSNVRAVLTGDQATWVATESRIFVDSASDSEFREAEIRVPGISMLPGLPRAFVPAPGQELPPQGMRRDAAPTSGPPVVQLPPAIVTSYGLVARMNPGEYRMYYVGGADRFRPAGDMWSFMFWGPPWRPMGGSAAGLSRALAGDLPFGDLFMTPSVMEPAAAPAHNWFARPIVESDGNVHIDAMVRYGGTLGSRVPQNPGVWFRNPAGTPVRAIGAGTVVHAGAAARGPNMVAIRHDRRFEDEYVFSTYHNNSSVNVQPGDRVNAGDVIARTGGTGSSIGDALRLEIHLMPDTAAAPVVTGSSPFPANAVNPQLWIEPLQGTGTVAGRVFNATGQPVPNAQVHGLVLAYPEETPFSYAETYAPPARPDPGYGEHFAVGDVPAGLYTLGVILDGERIWRRVRVQPGMVTWVEFRP